MNALPNGDAALDGDIISEAGTTFNEDVVTNIARLTDRRIGKDMGKSPHARAFANLCARLNERLWMTKIRRRCRAWRPPCFLQRSSEKRTISSDTFITSSMVR